MKKYSPRLELGLGTGGGITFHKIISQEPLKNLQDIKAYLERETWVKGIYGTDLIIIPPKTISDLSYYTLEGEATDLVIPKFNLEGKPIGLKIGIAGDRESRVNFSEGDYSNPNIRKEEDIIKYFMNPKNLYFTQANKKNLVIRNSLIYLALTYPKQPKKKKKDKLKNL